MLGSAIPMKIFKKEKRITLHQEYYFPRKVYNAWLELQSNSVKW